MFTRLLPAVLLLMLSVPSAPALAAADQVVDQDSWQLEKDADGIKVYTRAVAGSRHRAVRASMTVATPIAELVAIVRDTGACGEWAQFCAESHEHQVLSETEAYIYTLNDMPWPVSDRDALTHVVWSAAADTGAVHMEAVATAGILEARRGRVRLTDARTSWQFRPVGAGAVEVISEAHVDPAGPVPAWITNMLLVDAPFETMSKLRALAATGRYAGASFTFVPERTVNSR